MSLLFYVSPLLTKVWGDDVNFQIMLCFIFFKLCWFWGGKEGDNTLATTLLPPKIENPIAVESFKMLLFGLCFIF